ncbi:putative citrate transporter [Dinoroseobacter shibae DFL 12 = DSM 16493]|uniref:Putative citrate transporter n=1 Tax=Dinoroseobacter shibae (strain DSM 16493 / NCIMB 14021 / DFL 12) TaxID=398580 RepID=A8LLH2_DINSH|nr:putative citrate transporter [Dinoroseobacter shibae DFL 12 = DSM 16493]
MEALTLTYPMMVVLGLLGFTVALFVSEVVRIDFAAILVMVLLGLLSQLPGLHSLADVSTLFDGLASNAVVSIIAVMIIGAGLDKTGLMSKVAALILKRGGSSEARVVPIVSGTVGVISSFMQNVGAAALFLPVVSRISVRTGLPLSRLLMPMGFCAILGGTLTMVGSSPLILLNDLLLAANPSLPPDARMAPYGLFSVTPVGIALVATGILYFMLFGRWVLPSGQKGGDATSGQSTKDYLKQIYGLKTDIFEITIPEGHRVAGQTYDDLTKRYHVYIIGSAYQGKTWFAPVIQTEITPPCRLAVLGRAREVRHMAEDMGFTLHDRLDVFAEDYAPTKSGIAEVVIPPGSSLIGKCAHDVVFRKTYGASMLAIHRGEETLSIVETEDHTHTQIGEVPFRAGDTLVILTTWEALTRLSRNRDFVVVTSDYPQEEPRPKKVGWALLFFAIALGLILLTDLRLSLCLLTGAAGMILTRVLDIDEAYNAVSWSTVFLLASLIPLGQAVQSSGTAAWIAQQILILLDGWPLWALQAGLAVLSTVFTLIMSNVGATVLLVPLAISIAMAAGGDPALFALTVAISTSNSFLIPTHQVNALIMGPAGYKVTDFIKSGGIMTLLFLVVSLSVMNLVF